MPVVFSAPGTTIPRPSRVHIGRRSNMPRARAMACGVGEWEPTDTVREAEDDDKIPSAIKV